LIRPLMLTKLYGCGKGECCKPRDAQQTHAAEAAKRISYASFNAARVPADAQRWAATSLMAHE
jgi:hypothetical protein